MTSGTPCINWKAMFDTYEQCLEYNANSKTHQFSPVTTTASYESPSDLPCDETEVKELKALSVAAISLVSVFIAISMFFVPWKKIGLQLKIAVTAFVNSIRERFAGGDTIGRKDWNLMRDDPPRYQATPERDYSDRIQMEIIASDRPIGNPPTPPVNSLDAPNISEHQSDSDESISDVKLAESDQNAVGDSKQSNNDDSNNVSISSHTSAGDESKRDISIIANPNHYASFDTTIKAGEAPKSSSSPKPAQVTAQIHEDELQKKDEDAKTKALAKLETS